MLLTLIEVVGFCLVVAAAYLVSLPLALLIAGLGLMLGANLAAGRRRVLSVDT